jgi:hypothetical protein
MSIPCRSAPWRLNRLAPEIAAIELEEVEREQMRFVFYAGRRRLKGQACRGSHLPGNDPRS